MSQSSELIVTTLPYRPWSVRVPIVLSQSRSQVLIAPDWLSIRAANIVNKYMKARLDADEPYLEGFVDCRLFVAPGVSGAILTVEFGNKTVRDDPKFATPDGLQGELVWISRAFMEGFNEREAFVDCHGMLSHIEAKSRVKVGS